MGVEKPETAWCLVNHCLPSVEGNMLQRPLSTATLVLSQYCNERTPLPSATWQTTVPSPGVEGTLLGANFKMWLH